MTPKRIARLGHKAARCPRRPKFYPLRQSCSLDPVYWRGRWSVLCRARGPEAASSGVETGHGDRGERRRGPAQATLWARVWSYTWATPWSKS